MLVGLTSGKGSPGATWCLAHLGVALARAGHDVLAVDADPSGGALAAYLGHSPGKGLYPLARLGPRPTAEQLAAEAESRHGLRAVVGMPRASEAGRVDLVAVARAAAGLASFVLVDVGRLPGPGLPIVRVCDRVLLVVRPGPAGVLAGEQTLVALGEASAKVALVVSGTRRQRAGEVPELQALLRRPVAAVLPFDRRAWVAEEEQRPVRGRSAKAFDRLAAGVAGVGRKGLDWRLERGELHVASS